jgi:hypothetical protein
VTARRVAEETVQQHGPPAVPWQPSPDRPKKCVVPIGALYLHIVIITNVARQPHSFHDLAAVSPILPDQQIRNVSWIVETTSHEFRRDDGHVLAVQPRPRANEVLMPSAPLFTLFHRLIPATILSTKVPVTGCVFKESVKVRTLKSPPPADDTAFNLSAMNVFTHGSRAELQYFRRLANRQQTLSDWCRCGFVFAHSGTSQFTVSILPP